MRNLPSICWVPPKTLRTVCLLPQPLNIRISVHLEQLAGDPFQSMSNSLAYKSRECLVAHVLSGLIQCHHGLADRMDTPSYVTQVC